MAEADREVVAEVGRRYDSNQHLQQRGRAHRGADAGVRRPLRGRRARPTRAPRGCASSPTLGLERFVITGASFRRRPASTRRTSDELLDRRAASRLLREGVRHERHDLIIRGGTVVDGTGAPARTADVAIDDGVITEVGTVDGAARPRRSTPTACSSRPASSTSTRHYDGQATWDERMIPSSWHGVTTVVIGNCGVGFAPVRPADHDRLIELMEGVEDIPGAVLHEGLAWTWQSFPEFLDALDGRPFDVDVAVQVPHGALRLHVMGERGARPRGRDRRRHRRRWRGSRREAIEAGALGFTTSRTLNHRTSTGRVHADAHRRGRRAGRHRRGDRPHRPGRAAGRLRLRRRRRRVRDLPAHGRARRAGRCRSRSLQVARRRRGAASSSCSRDANADGVADDAARSRRVPVGLLLGLQCTLHPLLTNPRVPRDRRRCRSPSGVAIMADPAFKRARARRPTPRRRADGRLLRARSTACSSSATRPTTSPTRRRASPPAPSARAATPLDLAYDLLLDDGGRALLYVPVPQLRATATSTPSGEMLAHPEHGRRPRRRRRPRRHDLRRQLPDDAAHALGARPRPRPARRCRSSCSGRRSATARTVGLLDRGVLAPGYRADVNVIDFDALTRRPPEMRYDLPAGGKRLVQAADGYVATIVAGEVTYEHGEPTGPLPGRLVRGPQPAPPNGGTR